jgi:6-phosphogluconolactonase
VKAHSSFTLMLAAAIAILAVPMFAAAGAVYALNNSSSQNAVMVFNRTVDGLISPAGSFATGGSGTGTGLGSAGALAIDANNRFLFAVNAGSDSISVFRIQENGLKLVNITSSQGRQPISLTVNHNLLYVLNNGGAVGSTDTIAGFSVGKDGQLTLIVSGLPLSAASVGPAQIGFSVDGDVLLVTEKGTNSIDAFSVDSNGVAVGPTTIASAGQTPFGFAFGKRREVFVSDAFGGAANAAAVSSYFLLDSNLPKALTAAVADKQTAACWVVLTNDGRFAYTTNTGSGTISAYDVSFNGALSLQSSDAADTGATSGPIDAAISNDARYLYALMPGTGNVQGFSVGLDGSLVALSQAAGVPSSASGLVAR